VDGDGLFDLFVTHLNSEKHTLWRQGPRGLFQDRTGAAGLANLAWNGSGFGAALADFDLDGRLDLAFVNGHIARRKSYVDDARLGPHWNKYAERNQLFRNQGDGVFEDISQANPALCGVPNVGRGLCWGDIDGDGTIDLLVTTIAGPAKLLRNIAKTSGHWLAVEAMLPHAEHLDDPRRDRDACGAEVVVRAGERRWLRLVNPADSYQCSSDRIAHFGLGPIERVDAIEILWPDGTREVFAGGSADRRVVLRKGLGKKL
jgi:hypothetical protein